MNFSPITGRRGIARIAVCTFFAVSGLFAAERADAAVKKETNFEYSCKIKARRTGGWTPTETQFTINEAEKSVVVWDPFISRLKKKPIPAKAKFRDDGIVRFRWRLNVPSSEGFTIPVGYRIDFNPETETGTMWISVRSNAVRDTPGELTCKK